MNRYARAREHRRAAPPAPRDSAGLASVGQRRRFRRDDSASPVSQRVRSSQRRFVDSPPRNIFRPHSVGKTADANRPQSSADKTRETPSGPGDSR